MELVFGCPFCMGNTVATLVERKRVMAKCEKCDLIHVYVYGTDKDWHYEHSEIPKERDSK